MVTNITSVNTAPGLEGFRVPNATRPGPAQSGTAAIAVADLTKSYGDVAAVAGLDLEIQVGEIFALLGPNGAGKTTTVEILEGYRHRDGGRSRSSGTTPDRERKQLKPRIGIVLQSTGVDRYLTVSETIAMYASYYPHPRPTGEIVELVGLGAKRDTRVLKLSGGQQRRLDVAIALAGDPDLLFLDEPTTGFDPSARREAWEVVKNLAALGKTVLLDDALHGRGPVPRRPRRRDGRRPDRGDGNPGAAGRPPDRGVRIRFRVPAGNGAPRRPRRARRRPTGCVELDTGRPQPTLHRLTGWAIEHGIELDQLEIVRKSLEDVYLELTGDASVPEEATPRRRPRPRRDHDEVARAPGLPGPLRQQGLLAQPRVGLLHLRLPAHVPRDLHVAARPPTLHIGGRTIQTRRTTSRRWPPSPSSAPATPTSPWP